jgi:glutamine synthetase
MMMAGLDGIKNSYEPAAPIDKDPYELPPDETAEPP